MAFNIGFYAYAIIGHTRADQLLPQGNFFFGQNDSCENLDNFSSNRVFVYA